MRSAEILASSFVDLSDTLDAPWALGTVETCEAAGYFLQVGGTTIPFYTLFFYLFFEKCGSRTGCLLKSLCPNDYNWQ